MRFLSALSAVAAVAASAISEPAVDQNDHDTPVSAQGIEVIEAGKTYSVKLECVGCPIPIQNIKGDLGWQQPQDNVLQLDFTIDDVEGTRSNLLLNGYKILPLDATPPDVHAHQLPLNVSFDNLESNGYALLPKAVLMPLQYEHTVLRTQEQGQLWVQFDVTGLPLDMMKAPHYPQLVGEPVALDSEEQKLVQLLLQQQSGSNKLFIQDIQVVARADRVQPYRMKCGRLAMVQTTYDPREWDKYGKYGTWERMQNLVTGQFSVWPFALSLALLVLLIRRRYQQRQLEILAMEDDAEYALLSAEGEDALPAYADIPVIKVEEYE